MPGYSENPVKNICSISHVFRAPARKETFVFRLQVLPGFVKIAAKKIRAVDRAVPFRELADEFPHKCPGLLGRMIIAGICLPVFQANHKYCA